MKTHQTNCNLALIRKGAHFDIDLQTQTAWRPPVTFAPRHRTLGRAAAVVALCLVSLGAGLRADEPFSRDFPPSLRFTENYAESILTTNDDGWVSHDVVPNFAASRMTISARLSTEGMDLSVIDGFTEVQVSVGDFKFEATLGDDPAYNKGDTSARFALYAWDDAQEDTVEVGAVVLNWAGSALAIAVTAAHPDAYSIDTQNYMGVTSDVSGELDCTVRFGERLLESRTAYESGMADVITRTVGRGDDAEELNLSVVRLSGAIDSEKPKVALTSLARRGIVTSDTVDLSGSATDNIGVESVQVSINGGDYYDAALDGSAWTVNGADLLPGDNIVRIKAGDAGGNESEVLTRKVVYLTPFTVAISGNGNVGGGLLGTTLQKAGSMLVLKATPAAGWVFDGWTGGGDSDSAMLGITVTPGMSLTARFIVNPFIATKGSYNGLVLGGGSFSASIGANGSFSAKVNIGGAVDTFTGVFRNDGHFSTTIARSGKSPLAVDMQLDVSGGSDRITGTVSDGAHTFALSADRNVFNAANSAPQAGTYTVLLPANVNAPGTALADGFATLSVSKLGVATMAGALGDGTAFSYAAQVSKNGTLPISLSPYKNSGLLNGTATFRDTPGVSDLDATLLWIKSPNPADTFYPAGFETSAALVGGKYKAPAAGERIVNLTDALVTVGGGNLALEISKSASLGSTNLLTIASRGTSRLAVQIVPSSGLFTGSVVDPQSGALRKFQGAFLQKQNIGSGYFRGVNRTGYVGIAAQ